MTISSTRSLPGRTDQLRSPSSHQFSGSNVWTLLQARAQATPDRTFLIWHPFESEDRTWTYGKFAREAAAVAVGISRRGVQPGDRILIHLENCPEFVLAWFACAAIGAVPVTTNTRSAEDELRYYIDDSRPVGAITQPRFSRLVDRCGPELRWIVSLDHDAGAPVAAGHLPARADAFASLLGDASEVRPVPADPMNAMSIQYTSGTTSRPKGVVWTHGHVLFGTKVNAMFENLRPDDRHFVYSPLFHANGLGFCTIPAMWVGASALLTPKWSTSRFWDISQRYRPTWLILLGPAYYTLLDSIEAPPDNHAYRTFGGMCDTPLDAAYGTKSIGWWAMTETLGAPISGDAYLPNRPLSMGRPSAGYGIAVLREDGTPVEPDETGHLLVKGTRGLSLFGEYFNNPQATAESFDESGWFHTGDLVTVHVDGYLSYAGRSKDMLKVGGENVAASEIERVIYSVPGIVEAAVVARPDDWLTEVPVAFVRVQRSGEQTPEQVREQCARMLADFKVPREVHIVSEFPRSTIGKINKVELRAAACPDADRAAAQSRWIAEAKLDPSGDAG